MEIGIPGSDRKMESLTDNRLSNVVDGWSYFFQPFPYDFFQLTARIRRLSAQRAKDFVYLAVQFV